MWRSDVPAIDFPSGAFRREDEADTPWPAAWMSEPDDAALAALTRLYAVVVPSHGCVLDLAASRSSHLPLSFMGTAIGLGVSREAIGRNRQLTQAIVHDLNCEPRLPFNDAAFDAALCAVAVQYLSSPVEVFREVHRTLKPGSPFVVSFSNRWTVEKAVAIWRAASDRQHLAVVTAYFEASGGVGRGWTDVSEYAHTPPAGDPLYVVCAVRAA